MSLTIQRIQHEIIYPESDGKPMADNTLQWEWMVTIKNNLEALFQNDPDVFVASDLLWYPVEGNNTLAVAPDALVAFGRPKGHRGSYIQWREGGIAPQVVFEILSPNNTVVEMERKLRFYERYGPEEYYLYDPDRQVLLGWLRSGELLRPIDTLSGWVSPRLQIRFQPGDGDLQIYHPDGTPFTSYLEIVRRNSELAEHNAELAEQNTELAERNAELAAQQAAERERAERLAARLRELGIDPESDAPAA